MSNIKIILTIYEQIINLLLNTQTQLINTIQVENTLDLNENLRIVVTYIEAIVDLFEQIKRIIDHPECVKFIQKYNYYWLLDNTSIYIKTIEVSNENDFLKNAFVGLTLLNSSNINRKIYITNYCIENQRLQIEPQIDFKMREYTKESIYNMYGKCIFYCYLDIEGIRNFLNSNYIDIDSLNNFFTFYSQIVDYFKKYINTFIQYNEIYQITNKVKNIN